ncbi:metallophosphoesterase [Enterococcus spodopteracolus]|uniref:metallophosphoesterase n=1 Tax=Enterococcus spodopteracolus TaxID=3034501 RepID=UPI0026496432|nr:metallophosphoesterase [Enterococcus spodopteracolus]
MVLVGIIFQVPGQRPTNFPDEAENTLPRLYFVEALEQLREKLDPKLFNVGIVTDSHFDEGTWRTQAYRSMKNLNNVLYIQNDLDAIAALGDNVDSEHRDKSINVRNLERYCVRYSQGNNTNKFIIRGNHDSGSAILDSNNEGNNVFEKDIMTGAEQLEIFKKHLNQEGKFYGNGQYHYKDFHQKKIRMVFIDMIDNPLIRNQNGTLKYVDQWSYALQERQLQWLAEEALGTLPDDYHVAIFSHVPLMPETVTTDPIKNGELLKALLTAFINKESTQLHSNLSDFVVDFSVDFTQRKESHLVGLFAGHRHEEYFYSTNEMGGYYSTVFDCAFVRDDSKLGLVAEDAFAVLEIDTAHRKVRILGFGRATDREYTY